MMVGGVVLSKSDDDLMMMMVHVMVDVFFCRISKFNVLSIKIFIS